MFAVLGKVAVWLVQRECKDAGVNWPRVKGWDVEEVALGNLDAGALPRDEDLVRHLRVQVDLPGCPRPVRGLKSGRIGFGELPDGLVRSQQIRLGGRCLHSRVKGGPKGGVLKGKGGAAALSLAVLVWLLATAVIGCGGLTTVTSGTLRGSSSSSSMIDGTTAGTTGGSTSNGYGSLGRRIYSSGTDETGRPIPRSGGTGMMNSAQGCADCHGPDGRGRTVGAMMQSFQAPDIRWSTLSSPQDPDGQPQTPFDEAIFAHAVRDGVDPEGQRLKSPMPLWQVTDQEVQGLIAYLKTL
jgi:Cytochrome c